MMETGRIVGIPALPLTTRDLEYFALTSDLQISYLHEVGADTPPTLHLSQDGHLPVVGGL